MNDKFFQNIEREDYRLLQELNEKFNIKELGETPFGTSYDASGRTEWGDELVIEIKKRNQNLLFDNQNKQFIVSGYSYQNNSEYHQPTLMIETHKLSSLLLESVVNKRIPLYVNFLNDGYVAVFNLSKLDTMPLFTKNQKIKSVGYNKIEIGNRLYLNLTDAMIYKKINGIWKG